MSSSQPQELTEVKHLARLNGDEGREWECCEKREEDTGQRGIRRGMGEEGLGGKKNQRRHAGGKLSLWQGGVIPPNGANATADY